jgi:hypothetical protein
MQTLNSTIWIWYFCSELSLSTSEIAKWSCITGPAALSRISDQMANFNTTYRISMESRMSVESRLRQLHTGGEVKSDARAQLEADEPDLSITALFNSLNSDMLNAETYLGTQRADIHKFWVQRELKRLNFISDDPATS